MLDKIVIDGHFRWIRPLLIVIVTAAFTLYTVNPAIEYFTENSKEIEEKILMASYFLNNCNLYERI